VAIWPRRFSRREQPLAQELRKNPFFDGLSNRELRVLCGVLRPRSYKAGETIFDQGAPSVAAYAVLSGLVEIVQTDESGVKTQLSEAGPGVLLGETALLDDAPRTASAVVAEETSVAVFYRTELFRLAEERTDLAVKVALQLSQVVAERLRRTNRALKDVREQLEADLAVGSGTADDTGGGGV
jgi:CRP-like cAMP-binding protein